MTAPTALNVLLVEDEPDHAEIVCGLLDEGWPQQVNWTMVESLSDALELLAQRPAIDLMLLDLRLPDSSGIETVQRLRDKFYASPIVVLTSLDDGELGARAVSEGAQDYVVKSEMSAALLEKTVRFAIERYQYSVELARRNQDLLHFAHAVAHEIRGPMSAIKMGVYYLQQAQLALDDESQEMLSQIGAQVDDISHLITDLLQFSSGKNVNSVEDVAQGEACLLQAVTGLHCLATTTSPAPRQLTFPC